jgi:SAM-dependent methyltransferase
MADEGGASGDAQVRARTQGDLPPLPVRLLARGSTAAIARAPFLWRVLRRPTQRFWEGAASRWDDRIRPESAEHLAPLEAACDRLEPEPARILELGTGTGAGALMLARRFPGAQVTGVDISHAMIDRARGKAPDETRERLRFEVADAASLRYETGEFDLVCQLNLPLYADEIARVLAPGGHVVIASSRGSRTPYYTPERVVRRSLGRRGLDFLPGGRVGEGTYLLARKR